MLFSDLSCDNESSRMIVFTSQSSTKKNLRQTPLSDHIWRGEEGESENRENGLEMRNTFSAALQSSVWVWGVGVKQTHFIWRERVCVHVCSTSVW